ncbi:DUF2071 domain-containing protein [Virgibacillus sp. C22-A2]|uniref:DUF2071 domain-containing protein n=1 Tax=Virgibacillus tibetensis TaxID=3042313 RepID=A0ABU6KHN0_9BACI|nr:DUF2071 domain-containing protein [Virgibacillus sp. C22-A2]
MYKDIVNSTQHRKSPLPEGQWLMAQKWDHLLFMHLPVPPEIMKRQLPKGLDLDTYDGVAWLTIIPFRISDMRFRNMPPIPFLHSFLELNVRTYVCRNGIPGVYFFNLEADKLLAVLGARLASLPYFHAKMKMRETNGTFHYSSIRKGNSNIMFLGSYHPIFEAYYPKERSLPYWLLERYYLWTSRNNSLFLGGIHHKQWKIHDAKADIVKQNMANFLPDIVLNEKRLFHYAVTCRALFWPIKKVD